MLRYAAERSSRETVFGGETKFYAAVRRAAGMALNEDIAMHYLPRIAWLFLFPLKTENDRMRIVN